ncbi:LPXTG cell wall anchor domain-containing protein [Cryobacterium frigoriphilum]|uniref:LPXTG cell wall anchor domain-containing protein n=1 Tax=Cryobacterium frigoriphilum TaxID=1259150 RepID=A0A4R8ZUF1_9MICO|nr:metallophosphoesterase [Cryobacterium frigoriphilum]TFD45944.1 LPXTG cell wall anchor domain-containing protein [Cryobacterium frigoriphilum]
MASAAGEEPALTSPALASTNLTPMVVGGKTVPPQPRAGFRVLPYLQKPAATEMTINWFTELGTDAEITVTGPGLPAAGASATIEGVQNPVNAYQEAELSLGDFDNGRGLVVPQGEWIRADEPFKYTHTVTGLTAGADYTYRVVVDGYAHDAGFSASPSFGEGFTEPLHIIAYSDSETDPKGRVTQREWEQTAGLAAGSEPRPQQGSAWDTTFGGGVRNGTYAVNYMLTEDQAMKLNNEIIAEQEPDLLLLAGDLVERGSSQSHWDEFFRYFAGDNGHLLDSVPLITSLGNHEVYGYGTADDRSLVVRSRMEYNQYFDTFGSSNPHALDAYHRVDYGPVTVISVDSTNGSPDSTEATTSAAEGSVGDDSTLTPEQYGTDTQGVFTLEEYERDFHVAIDEGWIGADAEPDQPSFHPGSEQYVWFEEQLKDASSKGQSIVVQWHHVAYSNGVHGTTMGNDFSDTQPGTPMRVLTPLLEQYGVSTVISGHDEMFEASYVDEAGDGTGIWHWDVGVASDGLRGEKMVQLPDGSYEPYRFNTASDWMAHLDEPELWATGADGVQQLVSGGKHYGHLDIWIEPYTGAALSSGVTPAATMTMTPVAVFPTLDANYELLSVERREMVSGQRVTYLDAQGAVMDANAAAVPAPTPTPTPTASAEPTTSPEPTTPAVDGSAASDSTTDAATSASSTDSLADTGTPVNVVGMLGLALVAMAAGGGLFLWRRRANA